MTRNPSYLTKPPISLILKPTLLFYIPHTTSAFSSELHAFNYELSAFSFELQTKFALWGRNGFDGDKEALAAYRAFLSARKTDGNLNIIADDYAYAQAA